MRRLLLRALPRRPSQGNRTLASFNGACKVTPSSVDLSNADFELDVGAVKNWTSSVEETRALRSFTEETRRFRVPVLGRSQEELDLVADKDDKIHILTQNPFGVHTFTSMARNNTHSQHLFVNLHSLVPFGTPVPWLGSLPNSDLITFSPEMGCLIRLNLDQQLGFLHYIDEEENKSRRQRHRHGFSYFGASTSSEGKTPDEWGIAPEMLLTHGRVLVWRHGSCKATLFHFGEEGVEEGDSGSSKVGLRVDLELPADVIEHGNDGIASIACPSHNVWTISTTSGRQLVMRLRGSSFHCDPVTVHSIEVAAVAAAADNVGGTLPHTNEEEWNGQYTLGKASPFKPPSHLHFDNTARYGSSPIDHYYTTVVGQPKEIGHAMSMYASKREEAVTGDTTRGTVRAEAMEQLTANKTIENQTRQKGHDRISSAVVTVEQYGAYDKDPRNQNPDYGHRFITKSIRLEQQDQLVNVVHHTSSDYYFYSNDADDDDGVDRHVLVPVIEFVNTNDDVVRTIEAHLPDDALVGIGNGTVSQAEHRRSINERKSPPIVGIDEMLSTGELITLQAGGWVSLHDQSSVLFLVAVVVVVVVVVHNVLFLLPPLHVIVCFQTHTHTHTGTNVGMQRRTFARRFSVVERYARQSTIKYVQQWKVGNYRYGFKKYTR